MAWCRHPLQRQPSTVRPLGVVPEWVKRVAKLLDAWLQDQDPMAELRVGLLRLW